MENVETISPERWQELLDELYSEPEEILDLKVTDLSWTKRYKQTKF